MRRGLWGCQAVRPGIAVAVLQLAAFSARAGTSGRTDVTSLPVPLRAMMSATLGAKDADYGIVCDGGDRALFQAKNAGQGLAATLGPEGMAVRAGGAEWRLRLTGWGRAGAIRPTGAGEAISLANRVEVRRGDLVEWWVNGPLGLEQGWTVAAPPSGGGSGPLTLVLAQSGGLRASLAGERSLTVADGTGREVLRYGGLAAFDATGRELPARFAAEGGDLQVHVDHTGAVYPVFVDPMVQSAHLTASDGAGGDLFGFSVSASADGSMVVVGAVFKVIGGTSNPGAAYVFTKSGTVWTQAQELTASDRAANDRFGRSVSVSADGSTLVVGAPTKDIGSNSGQGAAYVFTKSGTVWTQAQELTASDGATFDYFGFSVSTSADGSTVVVGASDKEIGVSSRPGAAYVFTKSGTEWTQAQEVTASDGVDGDDFGTSVSTSGDGSIVVVGADYKTIGSVSNQGAAYVFTKSGTVWNQAQELTASDGAANDYFGWSISASGDGSTVVVGTPLKTSGSNSNQGATYIFTKSGTVWNQAQGLTASDGAANDYFGASVSTSGDGSTVVVGAWYKTIGSNSNQGATYVFTKSGTVWTQAQELTASDGAANDYFGLSVSASADGSLVAVGAPYKTLGGKSSQGAAYVFRAVGSASQLAFGVSPGNTVAGAAIAPAVTVQIQDALGYLTSSTANVTLAIGTNPGSGTLSGTATVTAVGGVATFNNLSIDKIGTGYTLSATSGSLTGATSGTFNISLAAPSKLAFGVSPGNTVAGAAIAPAITVQIQDAFGNLTASTANVTIAIGTNPGSGTLSGTATVSAAGGVATFNNLSIDKIGTGYTLSATSTGLTTATSAPFNITLAAPSKLAFGVSPSNTMAGAAIAPPVTVQIQDALGNLTTSTANVTIAIGTNPGSGTLGGIATVAAVGGVATFNNLSIDKIGTGYTLSAISAGLTAATSGTFNITLAAASKLAFVQQPTGTVAGATISPAVTVQIQDAQGNAVSTASVTITLSLTSGTGTLSGTKSQSTNTSGLATFNNLSIDLAGTKQATASSSGLTSAVSSSFSITGPGAIVATGGATQTTPIGAAFGQPLQVTVTDTTGAPMSGVSVVFNAPTSGASALLSAFGSGSYGTSGPSSSSATAPVALLGSTTMTVVTDGQGVAQASATANGLIGSYTVTATVGALPPASFALTNAQDATSSIPALDGLGLAAFALLLATAGIFLSRGGFKG